MSSFTASDVEVVLRDEHYLVVLKPPSLPTTAPSGAGLSLFELARSIDPRAPRLHPLSRLVLQVSGLLPFARTAAANRAVLEARRAGTLRRRYLALVSVQPSVAEGSWSWSIGLDRRDPRKRVALEEAACEVGAKSASTQFCVAACAGPLCALDLFPQTGRTHQLRVHAARAGSPLLGDVAYGGLKRLVLENGRVLTAPRVMLHCGALQLPGIAGSPAPRCLSAAAADDLRALWQRVGGPDRVTMARAL